MVSSPVILLLLGLRAPQFISLSPPWGKQLLGVGAAPRPGALGAVGGSGTSCPPPWGGGRAPGAAEVMRGKQAAGSGLRRGKILDKGEEGRMKAKTEGGLQGQTRLRCSHREQLPWHHGGEARTGQGR